jgi:rhodanese-related sulfurtransferase
VSPSADDLVASARRRVGRTAPEDLADVTAAGGLIIDIRPAAQREEEGPLPDALVVERNVLEWRLDPNGAHRLRDVTGVDQPVVVACSQGYASSLAAESLLALGFRNVTDLIGGYQAWSAWANAGQPTSEAAVPQS